MEVGRNIRIHDQPVVMAIRWDIGQSLLPALPYGKVLQRLPVKKDPAAGLPAKSRQHFRKLCLPVAVDTGHAQDLSALNG